MKTPYTPPVLTVVTFRVEQGFNGSPDLVLYLAIFNDSRDDNNKAATYTTEDWNW